MKSHAIYNASPKKRRCGSGVSLHEAVVTMPRSLSPKHVQVSFLITALKGGGFFFGLCVYFEDVRRQNN